MSTTCAPRTPARRLLAGVVTALAVALVAGCSGASAPGAAAPAAASDPNAPLPRYATPGELGAAAGGQQKADRTAKITLTGGLTGQTAGAITGDGALRFDDTGPSMQVTQRIQLGAGQPPLELGIVLLPDQAYVRPPGNTGALVLPPGKTWLRIVPNSTDPVTQQLAQMVQTIRDNADPTRAFSQFGDAVTIVRAVEEPLDGVRAMRYDLRVDIAKAAEKQTDPKTQQALRNTVQQGLTTLDYGLWLDGSNHILRFLLDQPLPQTQGKLTMDARYRDFGQPVQIDPPPADQVAQR
jgi:hypothetical protein